MSSKFFLAPGGRSRHLDLVTASSAAAKINVLSDGDRNCLRNLVDLHGLAGVAKLLGCSRGVVSSTVAGIGVRKGSLEQIRAALAAHRQETK